MKRISIVCVWIILLSTVVGAKTWVIMPVGNSITAGVGDDDDYGYRDNLSSQLNQKGIAHSFVGPDGGAYRGFFQPGADIQDFLPGGSKYLSPQIMNTYKPNAIILHLGTNNFDQSAGPYMTDSRLNNTASGYLAQLVRYLSDFSNGKQGSFLDRIILCKIPPRSNALAYVQQFNGEIDKMVFNNTPGFAISNITLANSVITQGDLNPDGIHPSPRGYADMGNDFGRIIAGLNRTDNSAPASIDWVALSDVDGQTASLQWRAVGDDGNYGQANSYELRYATFELNRDNFESGELVPLDRPKLYPKNEGTSITNLLPGIGYYFGIRAYDEWNNKGQVSTRFLRMGEYSGSVFCDNFDINYLDTEWSLNTRYYEVDLTRGELVNTATLNGWNYPAIYTAVRYNSGIYNMKAELTWSEIVDQNGMFATGVLMLMDDTDYNQANGYVITLRPDYIYLFPFVNGNMAGTPIMQKSIPDGFSPEPGSTFTVDYTKSATNGHVFSVTVNNSPLGQVYDEEMTYGNGSELYSGISLFGNRSNNVDEFCVSVTPLDPYRLTLHSGEGKHGKVTEQLPSPLSVRVLDINDTPVEDVIVDFSVQSGTAYLSTDSVAQNFQGTLWLEAEDGKREIPYVEGVDGSASGNRYIFVQRNSQYWGEGTATFDFYVPVAGNYALWVRALCPDEYSNSIFVAINNNSFYEWKTFEANAGWHWKPFSGTVKLTEGKNTLIIKNREPGTQIDKIMFSNTSTTVPSGLGGENQAGVFSNITSSAGIAFTEVTFSEQAGPVKIRAFAPTVPVNNDTVFSVYADALDPVTLSLASNTVIQGVAGQTLVEPFAVHLQDPYDNDCVGEGVEFHVTEGDGRFGQDNTIIVTSNEDGIAQAYLTLGYDPFPSTVEARIPDRPDLPVLEFQAVKENSPARIIKISGDNQKGVVAEPLSDPLWVQVLDTDDQPFAGTPVTFSIADGGGQLTGGTDTLVDTTDAEGYAAADLTLGQQSGTNNNVVTVEVPFSHPTLTFQASAEPASAYQLIKIDGDFQEQNAGFPFKDSLKVKVGDTYGNGIPDYVIRYRVIDGDIHFGGSDILTDTTDQNGLSIVELTAGNEIGTAQVQVEGDPALPSGSLFFETLQTLPTKASTIQIVDGQDQQAVVGTKLPTPLRVRITDPFDVPVPDIRVWFTVSSGGGHFAGKDTVSRITNENGYCSASFTIGTIAGVRSNAVRVTLDDSSIPGATFHASGLAAAASYMEPSGPTEFTGKAGEGPIPLSVRVRDVFDNPKPDHSVTFSSQGAGTFEGNAGTATSRTDANGMAIANFYMGTNTSRTETIIATSSVTPAITFTGTYIPGEPGKLLKQSGEEFENVVATTLDSPFVIQVTDDYDLPNSGVLVRFLVVAGGGHIGNNTEYLTPTDENGFAQCYLTLGPQAGIMNNKVKVSLVEYPSVTPIEFVASARADIADQLLVVGDSLWTPPVHSVVNPTVKVTDIRGNPIADFSVTFTVTHGGGTVNDEETVTVKSSSQGEASVSWMVGDVPDSNRVSVSASRNGTPLNHTPVEFVAVTRPAAPYYLELVSSQRDTGKIGQMLADPIQGKITDEYENPIQNHPVEFSLITGSGTFPDTDQNSIVQSSNLDGVASTYFQLGEEAGDRIIRVQSTYNGQLLINKEINSQSPFYVTVSGVPTEAYKITVLTDTLITRPVKSRVSVQVRVLDKNDNPVSSSHPVQFRILDDTSFLQGDKRFLIRNSNSEGLVSIDWLLGPEAGERINRLQIQSENNVGPLVNSPTVLSATLTPGQPNAATSELLTETPVTTGTEAGSAVQLTLRDSHNNPIPGYDVKFSMNGSGVTIENPPAPTNEEGKATGRVYSTQSGRRTVTASLLDHPVFSVGADIEFLSGPAAGLTKADGDQQTGNIGTTLSEPLSVLATDTFGNPVSDVPVQFKVRAGEGRFEENQQSVYNTRTDSTGHAWASLILGNNVGEENIVFVSSPDPQLDDTLPFTAYPKSSVATVLEPIGDTAFTATVRDTLGKPLFVRVLDSQGKAVAGVTVEFTPLESDAQILTPGSALVSNYQGRVTAHYRLGGRAGTQTVVARLNDNQTVTFTITGKAAAARNLVKLSGDEQSGTVKTALGEPFAILAMDADQNPKTDVPLCFSIEGNKDGRFLKADTVYTDSEGVATNTFVPGAEAGDYVIKVTSSHIIDQTLRFSCTIKPAQADSIMKISGNNQTMTAGKELLHPLVVKVVDAYGNPVPGHTLSFAPIPIGGGTGTSVGAVVQPADTTNEKGLASCRWILSVTPGTNRLITGLGLKGYPIYFEATGVDNDFPEFVGVPGDTTIYYNDYQTESFELPIVVHDGDNDPVTLQVTGLPPSATWVREGDYRARIRWTPQASDKGNIYHIECTATDNQGGIGRISISLRVDGNMPPQIIWYQPTEPVYELPWTQTVLFSVNFTDADVNDVHQTTWYIDNTVVAENTLQYLFESLKFIPGNHDVRFEVTDGKKVTSLTWTVGIVTSVELSRFEAISAPYRGIRIEWDTATEKNNAGFRVLRSLSESGPFESFSAQIDPNSTRRYAVTDTTAEAGATYYYLLETIDHNGVRQQHGPVQTTLELPKEFKVHQNYPNPFNPQTQIRFQLPNAIKTQVIIYNMVGQTVRTLVDERLEPGYHEILWDGQNKNGVRVGSGVYYYRVIAGDYSEIKKMALVK